MALGLLAADELGLLPFDRGAPTDATPTGGHSVGEITAAAVNSRTDYVKGGWCMG